MQLTSFNGNISSTFGTTDLTFPITKNEEFHIRFQVVKYTDHTEALNFDGISGSSVLQNGQAVINYKTSCMDIEAINCTTNSTNFMSYDNKLSINFMGAYPPTKNVNTHIVTIQDHSSKFLFFEAIPQRNAKYAVQSLVQFSTLYGIPNLSDNSAEFTSQIIKPFCEELKIQKITCTPNYPEANGSLERSHANVEDFIRIWVIQEKANQTDVPGTSRETKRHNRKDWDTYLQFALFAYNNTPHTIAGFCPSVLFLG